MKNMLGSLGWQFFLCLCQSAHFQPRFLIPVTNYVTVGDVLLCLTLGNRYNGERNKHHFHQNYRMNMLSNQVSRELFILITSSVCQCRSNHKPLVRIIHHLTSCQWQFSTYEHQLTQTRRTMTC